ncbi:SDR family oxidoreductase [Nocardioides terrisoli]|uniref:SDR family oxidoreductase n=1 Tax=Nocardioides terrisoli TaxID=3388267 RepID=UPI00287B86C6|nr:SDR family oxidoreductase [Nocardioides marmorisolisilvae]
MSRRLPQPDRRPTVVAGASSGIGSATAVALAARGFPVALGARRTTECEQVVDQIRYAGGTAVAHALDVTDAESVAAFAAKVTADLGDVEAVVSSAARLVPGRVHEVDTAEFAGEIDVNVLGVHRLVRAFVPAMVERRRGDVLLVSSDVVDTVRPFMSSYATGKWAVEGLARSLRLELEGTGVRVSVVRPGPTMTGMGMDWSTADTAMVLDGWSRFGLTRNGHFMKPGAVADVIAYVLDLPRGTTIPLVEVNPEPDLTPTEETP